ncbi:MAG: hypothetical protein U1E60_00455 [Reyranellaceae bacterium]
MARRKGRSSVIRPIDPLVKLLLLELDARGETVEAAAVRAGLGKDTIGTWVRARRVPNLGNMRAALGAVGFTLAAVKRADARQGPVVEKI